MSSMSPRIPRISQPSEPSMTSSSPSKRSFRQGALALALRVALGTALAAALALTPDTAEAQAHRWGAGFSTGGTWLSDLNPGADAEAVAPGLGAFLALHADRWYGQDARIGVRYQVAYQQPRFNWVPGERKIDAASADVSALFRLVPPAQAGAALPWVTVGLGGIWYDLGRGEPTFYGAADAYHDGGSRVLPVAVFGAGVDLDFPWQFQSDLVRLRLEVADHMAIGSPLRRTTDNERYGPVHNLRFSVGLYSALDFRRPVSARE
jgi:hypothetical protein